MNKGAIAGVRGMPDCTAAHPARPARRAPSYFYSFHRHRDFFSHKQTTRWGGGGDRARFGLAAGPDRCRAWAGRLATMSAAMAATAALAAAKGGVGKAAKSDTAWVDVQARTFTNWVNVQLEKVGTSISNLTVRAAGGGGGAAGARGWR